MVDVCILLLSRINARHFVFVAFNDGLNFVTLGPTYDVVRINIVSSLIQNARVAQWIEQKFPKLLVGGSTPLPGTIFLTQMDGL